MLTADEPRRITDFLAGIDVSVAQISERKLGLEARFPEFLHHLLPPTWATVRSDVLRELEQAERNHVTSCLNGWLRWPAEQHRLTAPRPLHPQDLPRSAALAATSLPPFHTETALSLREHMNDKALPKSRWAGGIDVCTTR
ncbi:hypothetical protein ACFWBN_32370 [Streptomyces sp. NPDC059989]|uniref:hypothetical protein n=1 Tax=Streptomyces sp. NPDC059989 TaxID=3347026 RepID=UPI00367A703E